MAEAEDVITDAAQHATALVMDYWQRRTRRDLVFEHRLVAHRKRLEILLRSLFNQGLSIRVAEPPARPTVLTRLFTRRPKRLFQRRALPAQDGHFVFLPTDLSHLADAGQDPARLYRVFATQQAQRALRRIRHLPTERAQSLRTPLEETLFQLIEAANADHDIARRFPGMRQDLALARALALERRPALGRLGLVERRVEGLYQRLLNTEPQSLPEPFTLCTDPATSLGWVRQVARDLERPSARFWGVEPDEWLGTSLMPEPRIESQPTPSDSSAVAPKPTQPTMQRRPQVRARDEDEDDPNQGFWMVQPSIPMEHAEDPMGMQRPTDREDGADAQGLAESLAELEEAPVVTTAEPANEILTSEDSPHRHPQAAVETSSTLSGLRYPEWDYRQAAYRNPGALVQTIPGSLGDDTWVARVLAQHRRQLLEVRRRFESLRTRRQIERRQIDGEDLDVAAYVAGYADRRAGREMSERLFQTERKVRRDCAVLLLIDISGSTDAWVSEQQRIIDVAKEALVLVSNALDGLGDPYAIQAFSGEGPGQVRVTELKAFSAPSGQRLYRHIAGLEPDRFTRVGAALRHATSSLMKVHAQRRLLILLSDGKPNDVDCYESQYGIEDTRQAVREAVLQGIHPFCITVDREAPAYMPHMFGPSRYAVLRQVHRLPAILLDVLRQFLRS